VDLLFSKQDAQPVGLTVVGLMTTPVAPSVEQGQSFFGVRFRPAMASALIPEVVLLTDKVEPLESFWGSRANALLNGLAECSCVENMVRIIEQQLRPLEPAAVLDRALSRLSSENAELNRVAAEHGMSTRHFRRRCQVRSGVSPKLLSRILRFRRAVERIRIREGGHAQPNWADFAAACGFYDQAHFIHEFQTFSGVTPGRFLQSTRSGQLVKSDCERNQA